MSNNNRATKVAYHEVPETCPKIDEALEDAADLIKVQTELLRDALIEAIEREMDANDEIIRLTKVIESLEDSIQDLESELLELRSL